MIISLLLFSSIQIFLFFPNLIVKAQGMTSTNYKILTNDINAGGRDDQTSTNYKMQDTIGGIATGISDSEHYKLKAGYRQMQEVYISVSAPETVIMVPALLAITGGTASSSTAINVKTDNPAGYKLELHASTSPALKFTDKSFEDYPRKTPPDFTWNIGSANSAFGFTPWGDDVIQKYCYEIGVGCNQLGGGSNEEYCWDGFDGTNIEIANSSSANHPSGTDTHVKYQAQIKANEGVQTPGDYTAVITATATAK